MNEHVIEEMRNEFRFQIAALRVVAKNWLLMKGATSLEYTAAAARLAMAEMLRRRLEEIVAEHAEPVPHCAD